MTAMKFFQAFGQVFDSLQTTQGANIHQAAVWVADAIMSDHFGVLFGSGHSSIPTMDVYPRIGSFPGWLPIHELATSYISRISGDVGLRQSLFLEKVEGYGKLLLSNYALDAQDVMIVISNSGVNTMGVEIAMEAKKMGLKTVGITSLSHSKESRSYHSSGRRLFEVVDLVIDNCVPEGDALVEIPGFPAKVAAASTIAGAIVMQAISAEIAAIFSQHNYILPVFPSHNVNMSEEETRHIEEIVEEIFQEDSRRIKRVIR